MIKYMLAKEHRNFQTQGSLGSRGCDVSRIVGRVSYVRIPLEAVILKKKDVGLGLKVFTVYLGIFSSKLR